MILINELGQLRDSELYASAEVEQMDEIIAQIRIDIESHQLDTARVIRRVDSLHGLLNVADRSRLRRLARCVATDDYASLNNEEPWTNSVGRRLESQMQLELLRSFDYDVGFLGYGLVFGSRPRP